MQVAGHRLNPRVRDADEGLFQVLVGESGALEVRAGRGAVDAFGQCARLVLEVEAQMGSLLCGQFRPAPTRGTETRRVHAWEKSDG